MKELILFSLKRKYFNPVMIIMNLLLIVVIGCGVHADKLIHWFNPRLFEPVVILVDESMQDLMSYMQDYETNFIFIDYHQQELAEKDILLTEAESEWQVQSYYPMDGTKSSLLQKHLNEAKQKRWEVENPLFDYEILEYIQDNKINNIVLNNQLNYDSGKQTMMFMMITSIYFMMLSTATVISNKVVHEKTTKILELVLTSVSASTHFLSKMIVGWLTLVVQMVLVIIYLIGWFLVRMQADQGAGLFELLQKLNLLESTNKTLSSVGTNLVNQPTLIAQIALGLLFLFVGILFVQMILVIVSSFVRNIEEAANIQGPFYLMLLGIYYFAISINTPYQMSEGIGYTLSFVPFFSMLFMPCRLLIENVSIYEITLSLFLSITSIYIIAKYGSKLYKRGVLQDQFFFRTSKMKIKQ